MEQEGQEVEGGKERGEMLFAVPKIVLQVVALGFEGVIYSRFPPSNGCDRLRQYLLPLHR